MDVAIESEPVTDESKQTNTDEPDKNKKDERLDSALSENAEALRWVGIGLIVVGALAVFFPIASTLAAQLMIGWLFMVAGGVMAAFSFTIRGTGPFFGSLLVSLLTFAAGMWLVFAPVNGAISITVLIAVSFFAQAVSDFYLAFSLKKIKGRFWLLMSGGLALMVAILIAAALPGASAVVLGLLVGINFISSGAALIAIRRHAQSASETEE